MESLKKFDFYDPEEDLTRSDKHPRTIRISFFFLLSFPIVSLYTRKVEFLGNLCLMDSTTDFSTLNLNTLNFEVGINFVGIFNRPNSHKRSMCLSGDKSKSVKVYEFTETKITCIV